MEHEGTKDTRANVHARITDQIVAAIAAGAAKFEMPRHRSGPMLGRPTNVVSKNQYRGGVNVLALWVAAQDRGFGTGAWATYRQWTALGGQVRKGERGSVIVFYKKVEPGAQEGDALAGCGKSP
jgi:antirestriction protein ArdC